MGQAPHCTWACLLDSHLSVVIAFGLLFSRLPSSVTVGEMDASLAFIVLGWFCTADAWFRRHLQLSCGVKNQMGIIHAMNHKTD